MAEAQQNEFAGVPVVVAGGHLGVGPAVVRAFAAQGAKVVVGELAHQPPTEAQRQACALPGVKVLPLDLRKIVQRRAMFELMKWKRPIVNLGTGMPSGVGQVAREEGLFAGISAAGACWVALELSRRVENATIVFIVCDRGDRYLSTGVFPA